MNILSTSFNVFQNQVSLYNECFPKLGIRKSFKKKQKLYEKLLKYKTEKRGAESKKTTFHKKYAKKTWNAVKQVIGKTNKSGSWSTSQTAINKNYVASETGTANEFIN